LTKMKCAKQERKALLCALHFRQLRDNYYHYYYHYYHKNEKIRVTLCENAAGALYIDNKMSVVGQRNVQG